MSQEYIALWLWGVSLGGLIVYGVVRHLKRRKLPYSYRPRSHGPGAMGAMWNMLNEDQQHTMEIIVERRAEERRPEYPDGDLPKLKNPSK
jgi:hypothetical protein